MLIITSGYGLSRENRQKKSDTNGDGLRAPGRPLSRSACAYRRNRPQAARSSKFGRDDAGGSPRSVQAVGRYELANAFGEKILRAPATPDQFPDARGRYGELGNVLEVDIASRLACQ